MRRLTVTAVLQLSRGSAYYLQLIADLFESTLPRNDFVYYRVSLRSGGTGK